MAANFKRLIALGMVPDLAKEIATQIDAEVAAATVAWADVSGTQAGVEAAVAAKTEIAALDSESTAAEIVAALQA